MLELALSPREKPGVTRGCPGVRRVPTELVDSSFRKSREGDRKCRSSRKGVGAPTRSLVTRASAGAAGALAVLSGGQTVEPPHLSPRVPMYEGVRVRASGGALCPWAALSCLAPKATRNL